MRNKLADILHEKGVDTSWLNVLDQFAEPATTLERRSGTTGARGSPKKQEAAARLIQAIWRVYVLSQKLPRKNYERYTSLISAEELTCTLSLLMFGQCIAQYDSNPIENPFAKTTKINRLFYHREQSKIHEKHGLFQEFLASIPADVRAMIGRNILDSSFVDLYCLEKGVHRLTTLTQLAEEPDHIFYRRLSVADTVTLRLTPDSFDDYEQKLLIKNYLSKGKTLSFWQMAEMISNNATRTNVIMSTKQSATVANALSTIRFAKTNEQLLQYVFLLYEKKLLNKGCPTYFLLQAFLYLLERAPVLPENAIKRIAFMATDTYLHAKNYDKFALLIYIVLHEISLVLSIETEAQKQARFSAFQKESRSTILNALGIEKTEPETGYHIIGLPANSGMNAYALALQLSGATSRNKRVLVYGQHYFENHTLHNALNCVTDNPDIITCCPGEIFQTMSSYSSNACRSVNLNVIIQKAIIEPALKDPITLLVDTTSALYQQIKLNTASLKLINQGMLSIILFESHQKFGLLHSDQAQYGRVMALLHHASYSEDEINRCLENARVDFCTHIDMRIGAFVDYAVPISIRESIKKRTFDNGVIFNFILDEYSLDTLKDKKDTSQLFYYTSNKSTCINLEKLFSARDSFGHFNPTITGVSDVLRLSPGGSDAIDTTIQAISLKVMDCFSTDELIALLRQEVLKNRLSDQILTLALLSAFTSKIKMRNEKDVEFTQLRSDEFILFLKTNLNKCQKLFSRSPYMIIFNYIAMLSKDENSALRIKYGENYIDIPLLEIAQEICTHFQEPEYEAFIQKIKEIIRYSCTPLRCKESLLKKFLCDHSSVLKPIAIFLEERGFVCVEGEWKITKFISPSLYQKKF